MGRKPKKQAGDIRVTIRLGTSEVQQVDAFAADLNAREPGIRPTRSDALRTLILRGLKSTR